jgi:hypothetical protein
MVLAPLAVWTMIALHSGVSMRRYGRRWWVWFLIAFFFTALPALAVSLVEFIRSLTKGRQVPPQEQFDRCRHCGGPLPDYLPTRAGQPICPKCGMAVQTDRLA